MFRILLFATAFHAFLALPLTALAQWTTEDIFESATLESGYFNQHQKELNELFSFRLEEQNLALETRIWDLKALSPDELFKEKIQRYIDDFNMDREQATEFARALGDTSSYEQAIKRFHEKGGLGSTGQDNNWSFNLRNDNYFAVGGIHEASLRMTIEECEPPHRNISFRQNETGLRIQISGDRLYFDLFKNLSKRR